MPLQEVKVSSVIGGVATLGTLFFFVLLIIQALRNKKVKPWLIGFIIFLVVTIVSYSISFLGIFQLYDSVSR